MKRLVVVVLCLACKGKRAAPPPVAPEDGRAAPRDAAVDAAVAIDAAPDGPGFATTISSAGVGPITASVNSEGGFAKRLPGFKVTSEHREAEDYSYDEVVVSREDELVLRAVISEDALFKVVVLGPPFSTSAGVTVGSTVGELAAELPDVTCLYETYDPEADAERVDRSLRCSSAKLSQVLFEIDLAGFAGAEGPVTTRTLTRRKIVEITWLASP